MAKIRKVLVVDNNATIVELVSSHLADAGYEVAKAFDGLQALDRLVESDQLPDVILLDLIMPRLDGQRLTRFLKQDPLYAAIPIIILTGIASEDEGTILAFGADAYIAKGRIEDTMAHILETFRWLESRTGARGDAQRRPRRREALPPRDDAGAAAHQGPPGHHALDDGRRGGRGRPGPPHPVRQPRRLPPARRRGPPALRQVAPRFFRRQRAHRGGTSPASRAAREASPPPAADRARRTAMLRITFSTLRRSTATTAASIVILKDVTAQVRRERSLLDLMEAIVQHAPVGLCLLDAAGTILASNPAFSRILHLPEGRAAIGTSLRSLPRRDGARDRSRCCPGSPTRPAARPRSRRVHDAGLPRAGRAHHLDDGHRHRRGQARAPADRGRDREGRHGARPAAGERGAREGQPRQEHLPLDGLPRTAHAALGGARLPLAHPGGQDRPGPRAHPGCAAGRRQAGAPPPAPDRGASRPLADRVRAPLAAQGADRGGQARARGRRDVPRRPGPQEALDRGRDPRRRCPTRWRTTTRSTRSSRTSCRTP